MNPAFSSTRDHLHLFHAGLQSKLCLQTWNQAVIHAARHGHLPSIRRFRLNDRRVDHVLALDLDHNIRSVFLLHEKVRIIVTQGIGLGIDVAYEEFRLPVRQHAREPDLLDILIVENVPEEFQFRIRVEAIIVEMEALALERRIRFLVTCGQEPVFDMKLKVALSVLRRLDQQDLLLCHFRADMRLVEPLEKSRDDLVIQKLVATVDCL